MWNEITKAQVFLIPEKNDLRKKDIFGKIIQAHELISLPVPVPVSEVTNQINFIEIYYPLHWIKISCKTSRVIFKNRP